MTDRIKPTGDGVIYISNPHAPTAPPIGGCIVYKQGDEVWVMWPDGTNMPWPHSPALLSATSLGQRALAIVLSVEPDRTEPCPVCGSCDFTTYKHADSCEWGQLVKEAKALG